MIAPLLQLAPPPGVAPDAPPLLLGSGQAVSLAGPFRTFWRDAVLAAVPVSRLHNPDAGKPLHPPGERMLTVVEFPDSPRRREIAEWLAALEPALQSGGAALFFAPRFPESLPLTRMLPNVASGSVRDDADQPVEFLRCGEWGALLFKPPTNAMPGGLRMHLSGAGGAWVSPWWQPPASLASLHPLQWRAEFAVPCPPGEYRAVLECAEGAQSTPVRLLVKPAACFPPPHRFEVLWRTVVERALPPEAAARLWRDPAAIARRCLDLAMPVLNATSGWQALEQRTDESWHERRWIGAHAEFTMEAPAGRLQIRVEDHRPRAADAAPTVVTVRMDGRTALRQELLAPGAHRLECDWPGDGRPHTVAFDVHPIWSPGEFGGEDSRRLGLLIYAAEVVS